MSERRACRVIDADRKSVRYRSTRGDDADLREKLRELANQRRRFGYRRLHILLRREPPDPHPPCPCCGGHMVIIETFQRCHPPRGPPSAAAPSGQPAP